MTSRRERAVASELAPCDHLAEVFKLRSTQGRHIEGHVRHHSFPESETAKKTVLAPLLPDIIVCLWIGSSTEGLSPSPLLSPANKQSPLVKVQSHVLSEVLSGTQPKSQTDAGSQLPAAAPSIQ